MRHVARKKGADEEIWGVIGLIHEREPERGTTGEAPLIESI